MRFKREIALFLTPCLILLGVWLPRRETPCGEKIEVSLGALGPRATSKNRALVVLSQEMKRCARAKKLTVWRSQTVWFSGFNHWGVYYNRAERRLREVNPETGDNDNWENVSEAAIHGAAAQGGNWNDLAQFGAVRKYPYG